MAFPYEQKFNELNNGDLHNQDNWNQITNGARYTVQEAVAFEGAKAIKVAVPNHGEPDCVRVINATTDGIVYIALRSSVVNNYVTFYLTTPAPSYTNIAAITMRADGHIYLLGAGLTKIYDSYSANTWYLVALEYNCATDKARAKVYDGSWGPWSDWQNFNLAVDNITIIRFEPYGANGAFDAYWDTITPTDPITPPSPNLTDRKNYSGYLAFIQQYIKHRINGTTPWRNPQGDLLE